MTEESVPSQSERGKCLPWTSKRLRLALGILMALHLLWLRWGTDSAYRSPDGGGYAVQARLLATQAGAELKLESDVQYIGGHWMETPDGRYYSQYPPGFPLLQAAAYFLFGPAAALWMASLLATGLLLLVYLLARELVAPPWALAAAASMAVNGVANAQALQTTSHNAAVFFLVLGLYGLLRFVPGGSPPRGILAGLALGVVPTIRYGDSIVAIAVVVFLARQCRPWWRAWPVAVGFAAPVLALACRNTAAFGRPWRTGYGFLNEETAFSLRNLAVHLRAYTAGLQSNGLHLFFAFGLAGLAYLAFHPDRDRRDAGLLFSLIVVSICVLYTAFYFSGGSPERYFLPAFPLMSLAAVALLAKLAEIRPFRPVTATVLVVQLAYGIATTTTMLRFEKREIRSAARIRDLVAKHVPPGHILTTERKHLEPLDYTGRWRLADDAFLRGRDAWDPPPPGPSNAPWFRQRGMTRLQRTTYAQLPASRRAVEFARALFGWSGTGAIYWLGAAPAERLLRNTLAGQFAIEHLADDRGHPLSSSSASSDPSRGAAPDGSDRRAAVADSEPLVLLRILK